MSAFFFTVHLESSYSLYTLWEKKEKQRQVTLMEAFFSVNFYISVN